MSILNVGAVCAVFALLGIGAFFQLRPPVAVWVVFFGGWLVLPVGHYPAPSIEAGLPYWIVGTTLPSDMLLTKAWVAPCLALAGVAWFDRERVRRWRPGVVDMPIALWCLLPWMQSAFVATPEPGGGAATLYLCGTWGATWWLGRLYGTSAGGQVSMLRGLLGFALASLPIAVIEGVFGPVLYGWIYEPHPFRFADVERYAGFRPIGFLENGNQYGLWICLCALAAAALAVAPGRPARDGAGAAARFVRSAVNGTAKHRWGVAVVIGAMAVAAQSAGALVLLAGGIGGLLLCSAVRPRSLAIGVLAVALVGGAVYFSGRLPVERLRHSPVGEVLVQRLKDIGRGSFGWRIAQDQRLLGEAKQRPLTGSGRWDWWRSRETRPWGLPVLLLGQYGGIGLVLCVVAWLAPVVRVFWRAPRGDAWRPEARPVLLAMMVLIAAADAALNSFIFFPALAIAGGLAGASAGVRQNDEDAPPAERAERRAR